MMLHFKSFVATSAALTLLSAVSASVIAQRNEEPAQPSCTSFTPFVYAGCFQDPSSPRALLYDSQLPTQNMTVEICVAFCKGNDYKYAGLEYYGECFCGASVNGPQIDESNCNYPCTGDASETCGGNDIVSIYQDPTFPVVDDTTIADFQLTGCYSDNGSNGRSLAWRQDQLSTASLTVEECLSACKNGGYSFAGVEYAQECYCGVVLGNGTISVPSSQCNMPCTGNSSETCGGSAVLNLYVATDMESDQPCNALPPSSSSMTSIPTSTPTSSPTTSCTTSTLTSSTTDSTSTPTTSPTTNPTTTPTTASTTALTTAPTTAPTTSPTTSPTTAPTTSLTTSPTTSPTTAPTTSITTSPTTSSTTATTTSITTSPTTSSTTAPTTSPTTSPTTTPITTRTTSPTTALTTSTTRTTSTTPTTASLCTSTVTISPKPTCEYKCGNWCSSPLPPFTDLSSCGKTVSSCTVQFASCFLQAGFPASLDCWKFSTWCASVSQYCGSFCPGNSCSLGGCKSKYPPPGPVAPTPTISTSVYSCPIPTASPTKATTSAAASTTTCVPIPTQSNICSQANNPSKGYGSSSPVGGIPLPCLTCNNLISDYKSGNHFKLYTAPDSSSCPSYSRSGSRGPAQGCKDACDSQYNACLNTYAAACKSNKRGDNYSSASLKCQNQWNDCYSCNSGVSVSSNRCGSFNAGWW